MVIEAWGALLLEKSQKPSIILNAGEVLHHGARRTKEELEIRRGNWLFSDHWYTAEKSYARNYAQSWSDGFTEFAMIEVESLKDLKLLDLSGVQFNDWCQLAINQYGSAVVGSSDSPIRYHMKDTFNFYLGNEYQGYTDLEFKEIFIFDFFHKLIISKHTPISA
jgi:hypothetical protein